MNVSKTWNGKKYRNVQCLQIGKAAEEGENHLGIGVVSKTHIQTQDIDAGGHGAWTRLHPGLEWTQINKQTKTKHLVMDLHQLDILLTDPNKILLEAADRGCMYHEDGVSDL